MSEAMRVAITLEQCWHPIPGGTGVAAVESARALALRTDVDLVGVAAHHRADPPDPWKPSVTVHKLPLPRLALYESWHRLRWPPVQRATGPVDVIHATTIAMPPRTAPLVVTIHDLLWRRDRSLFTKRGVAFFERGLALALKDADLVMCAADATIEDCIAAGFDPTRIRKVPLGIDAAKVDDASIERTRDAFGLTSPYILWVGTIEPRKNLKNLIAAFERLPHDVDLVLVGPEGWGRNLDMTKGGKRSRIKSLGFVGRAELAALYAGATVLSFPSLFEGFGFPVLEAMVQGTPVVTSRGTSTEEIAGDAAVLIEPTDPDDIARGIAEVLDDDARRRDLGRAGIERASRFTWQRTASLIADVYAEARGM